MALMSSKTLWPPSFKRVSLFYGKERERKCAQSVGT